MGFKPLNQSGNAMVAFDQPLTLVGYYRGWREQQTKKNPRAHRHTLEVAEGLVDFFGNTVQNSKLDDLPVGTLVEIAWDGTMRISEKSGNEYKDIQIGVWDPEDGDEPPFPPDPQAVSITIDDDGTFRKTADPQAGPRNSQQTSPSARQEQRSAPPSTSAGTVSADPLTRDERLGLFTLARKTMTDDDFKALLVEKTGLPGTAKLTRAQYVDLVATLTTRTSEKDDVEDLWFDVKHYAYMQTAQSFLRTAKGAGLSIDDVKKIALTMKPDAKRLSDLDANQIYWANAAAEDVANGFTLDEAIAEAIAQSQVAPVDSVK